MLELSHLLDHQLEIVVEMLVHHLMADPKIAAGKENAQVLASTFNWKDEAPLDVSLGLSTKDLGGCITECTSVLAAEGMGHQIIRRRKWNSLQPALCRRHPRTCNVEAAAQKHD